MLGTQPQQQIGLVDETARLFEKKNIRRCAKPHRKEIQFIEGLNNIYHICLSTIYIKNIYYSRETQFVNFTVVALVFQKQAVSLQFLPL